MKKYYIFVASVLGLFSCQKKELKPVYDTQTTDCYFTIWGNTDFGLSNDLVIDNLNKSGLRYWIHSDDKNTYIYNFKNDTLKIKVEIVLSEKTYKRWRNDTFIREGNLIKLKD